MLPKNRIINHPGQILNEEFLKPLNLSANALALALRVPANRITGIINGERAISADTALRLARYFGTTPEFWIGISPGTIYPGPAWKSANRSRPKSWRAGREGMQRDHQRLGRWRHPGQSNCHTYRLTAMRAGMSEMRTDLLDGQTVLAQMIMRLEKDMVRVKDLFGKMDGRIAHLEKATP